MEAERYAGERRALRHFLGDLRPLVLAEIGRDSLLYHRIDRALKRSDLRSLRDARRAFHHQPRPLKRRLLQGLLDPAAAGEGARGDGRLPERGGGGAGGGSGGGPTPTSIRFEAGAERWTPDGDGLTVSPSHTPLEGGLPVQVLIRPGTLPRAAAAALRAVADRIEEERRLLSPRYWQAAGGGADDGARGNGGAGNVDQA
jgi:hypothetical protein